MFDAAELILDGVETGIMLGFPFGVDMDPMIVGDVDVAAEDIPEEAADVEEVGTETTVSLEHPDSK